MKKFSLLFISLLMLACGVKNTKSMLSNGDYDGAIYRAVEGLRTNKNSKSNQDYVYLLEEAFAKAKERDQNSLTLLISEKNGVNLERIYNLYLQLNNRQEKIKPLLPLNLLVENRQAIFPFESYNSEIIASKADLSVYLYNNAKKLLNSKNKMDFRKAFDDFSYLEQLNSDYKDTRDLIDLARSKGMDYVYVNTKNDTDVIIPKRLQEDLLDFSTYNINDKWTTYHNKKQNDVVYDFKMLLTFRDIKISPEQVKEKQFVKEKQIKDGQKPLLDANGNQVKDDKGVPIKVDNFKAVTVSVYEFTQNKACAVTAKFEYFENKTNQLIDTFPLASEFVFNYVYATFNGDRRACEENYWPFFDKRVVPFPTNEQMVFDAGEDLKVKLKQVITGNKIRRN